MRRAPLLGWVLFFAFALWAFALQGVLASPRVLGPWTPDLGLVLLGALGPELSRSRLRGAACLLALARMGSSADPPAALLAGYLGAAGVGSALRSGLEIDRPLPRALLAGFLAWGLACSWIGARSLALAAELDMRELQGAVVWPGALATAAATLFLAPACTKLPGLARLRRRSA